MKKSKSFFKLKQDSGEVFWNKTPVKAKTESIISINNQEYDIKPNIQEYFTNTRLTTKPMNNEYKLTVFIILKNVGFYDNIPKIGFNSARMKDALYNLPKEIAKI